MFNKYLLIALAAGAALTSSVQAGIRGGHGFSRGGASGCSSCGSSSSCGTCGTSSCATCPTSSCSTCPSTHSACATCPGSSCQGGVCSPSSYEGYTSFLVAVPTADAKLYFGETLADTTGLVRNLVRDTHALHAQGRYYYDVRVVVGETEKTLKVAFTPSDKVEVVFFWNKDQGEGRLGAYYKINGVPHVSEFPKEEMKKDEPKKEELKKEELKKEEIKKEEIKK